jgi:hypothetical protein
MMNAMSNETPQHLESIGHLCQSLQSPVARIQRAVESLGVRPAMTINGIPHYDGPQCEQIALALRVSAPDKD